MFKFLRIGLSALYDFFRRKIVLCLMVEFDG